MDTKYTEADFIQVAPEGEHFGRFWAYKYRVLGRNGVPSHHTNSIDDARGWFKRCVDYWEKQKDNNQLHPTANSPSNKTDPSGG